jgi:hypothetical protein
MNAMMPEWHFYGDIMPQAFGKCKPFFGFSANFPHSNCGKLLGTPNKVPLAFPLTGIFQKSSVWFLKKAPPFCNGDAFLFVLHICGPHLWSRCGKASYFKTLSAAE